MAKKQRKGTLRSLLFSSRKPLRELEKMGVSREELKTAVRAIRADSQWPTGENPRFLAEMVVAELLDNPKVQLPKADGAFIERITKLIETLMPLVETWISLCG